jgi:hypothetical protein
VSIRLHECSHPKIARPPGGGRPVTIARAHRWWKPGPAFGPGMPHDPRTGEADGRKRVPGVHLRAIASGSARRWYDRCFTGIVQGDDSADELLGKSLSQG